MTDREFFRHTVATLAYRASKVLRDAPAGFGAFRPAAGSRSAGEILAHMGDLLDWALSMATGKPKWNDSEPLPWDEERERFFAGLKAFDDVLGSDAPLRYDAERLFQGPIADALTHTGQLGQLRRLHGVPVRGESYNHADIAAGRVGPEQVPPDPKHEFD